MPRVGLQQCCITLDGRPVSFSIVTPAPARLNRSQLFVLASKPATFEAAARSATDLIMFEIEDGVPPGEKPAARRNLIAALNDIDWGRKSLSVRINGLDTPHMYRDLVDLLEAHTERLDLIMIPKAGNRSDIYAVDMLVTQIETGMRRQKRLGSRYINEFKKAGVKYVLGPIISNEAGESSTLTMRTFFREIHAGRVTALHRARSRGYRAYGTDDVMTQLWRAFPFRIYALN